MTLKEIIETFNKNKSNKIWIDFPTIGYGANLDTNEPFDVDQDRLTGYWIDKFYTKNSYFETKGYVLYFLDDEPVAISQQEDLFDSITFYWLSVDLHKKVCDYIIKTGDDYSISKRPNELIFIDLSYELDETYSLFSCDELKFEKYCIYENQFVKILGCCKDCFEYNVDGLILDLPNPDYVENEEYEWISCLYGKNLVVEIYIVDFPYNIEKYLTND